MIPTSYSIRLAIVKNVGRTYIDFEFLDRIDAQTFRAPIPHPYAGRGGGVFAGVERDTIIVVASGPGEKWYCVGVIPDHNFYFDLDGAPGIKNEETSYPAIKEGEIIIKSSKGPQIGLLANESINLNAGAGLASGDLEISGKTKSMFGRTYNKYDFGEYGRSIYGVIRRDTGVSDSSALSNFLDSPLYDEILSYIGRFSKNEVQSRSARVVKQTIRNPALVEKREIVYEYANSFNVRDFEKEIEAMSSSDVPEGNTCRCFWKCS
jgi:hypothetical protein